ncbi:uncharacterized protein LOC116393831 isoform X2 [Anarrhichthys ocellatus]|uniref:uncharacterized protein LOC116393831 isoform X2 n=1 Tax=Anarrhichthys ocellatus TaxID=433405 RepID=UPI0012ED25BB|nr:uncharacterized protein LOC116393831 isoform X2 [Anarrhichthys ocellatus]
MKKYGDSVLQIKTSFLDFERVKASAYNPVSCHKAWETPPATPHKQHPHGTTLEMDSLMSLGAPLKQFTSCVSGKPTSTKRAAKGSQSVRRLSFTRRKSVSRRRSLPCSNQKVPDSWLKLYQDDLKRESKPYWPRRTQRGQLEKLTSGATTVSQGRPPLPENQPQ